MSTLESIFSIADAAASEIGSLYLVGYVQQDITRCRPTRPAIPRIGTRHPLRRLHRRIDAGAETGRSARWPQIVWGLNNARGLEGEKSGP